MVSISILTTYLAADDTGSTAAAFGVSGFMGIELILLIIYSVISLLIPIYIYRIMRLTNASYNRLGEMRDLLRKQDFLYDQAHPKPPNPPQIKNIVTYQVKEPVRTR
jgi:hypothetical protein